MNWQETTVATYDRSASGLSAYFSSLGARVADIERALLLADKPTGGRAVEIGCGDGRDAAEILTRVSWYQGFDPSSGLLELARRRVPTAQFVQADAASYTYPQRLDVVYAFASLLHVPREELPAVFAKVGQALRTGGVFYISVKESPHYREEVKRDAHGERLFYFYSAPLLCQLAGSAFEKIFEDYQQIGPTSWLTVAFKKLP